MSASPSRATRCKLLELIFFGHDARDAAVQRRIEAFDRAGVHVQAFTMRRGEAVAATWDNVDLGETRDAAFGQRVTALLRARPTVLTRRAALARADVIYARNLDMLMLAHWARQMSGSTARLVYECLDVHRLLAREDLLGAGLRMLERRLLDDTTLVVVSSPAFVREHFERRHPGRSRTTLVENRLPWGRDYGPRSVGEEVGDGPLRIGWFGNLRCQRSLSLLLAAADSFPDRLQVTLRGAPAHAVLPDFERQIAGRGNVKFAGRYDWPRDLPAIYAGVDLVWAGDFHDPSANSKWLLPNRLYEGGYYATPPLAPSDCETGRWIDAHDIGFTLAEPLQETLPAFLRDLTPASIAAARRRLLAAPMSWFVQPENELAEVLDEVMSGTAR